MTTLAQRIEYILRETGLKKIEFARALGISANYVSLLAAGKKAAISEPLARLIERTYGYRAVWLLTGEEPVRTRGSALRREILDKVRQMDARELRAVAALVQTLEDEKL